MAPKTLVIIVRAAMSTGMRLKSAYSVAGRNQYGTHGELSPCNVRNPYGKTMSRTTVDVVTGNQKSSASDYLNDVAYDEWASLCASRIPTNCSCRLEREDYTVGWLSALPVELKPALNMMDHLHEALPQKTSDPVVYKLGRIGAHNVVMTCLPIGLTGTNAAASIATQMRATFTNLRFVFLVGVGGGVPSRTDIRLGDIIVSTPTKTQPAALQYDFGKSTTKGFERSKMELHLPELLRHVISAYQGENLDDDGDFQSHFFKPKTTARFIPQRFPGQDLLFAANYNHRVPGKSCYSCNPTYLLKEPERSDRKVKVHYGAIASGNHLIRDARHRDQLSTDLGHVLCFEMEAAGIINVVQGLIIRGICDYADSHKNKDRQVYAACTAAAYAKELLLLIPVLEAQDIYPNQEKSSSESTQTRTMERSWQWQLDRHSKQPTAEKASRSEIIIYDKELCNQISDYDHVAVFRRFHRKICEGTTKWIFSDARFQTWAKERNPQCLWLTGKIGSGKSVLTSAVIDYLLKAPQTGASMVMHFFFSHLDHRNLTALALLASLIKQMKLQFENINRRLSSKIKAKLVALYTKHVVPDDLHDLIESIFEPLQLMFESADIVIDGLDEIDPVEILKVLQLVRSFLRTHGRRAFLSGRKALDLARSIDGAVMIEITGKDAVDDITNFIHYRIAEKWRDHKLAGETAILKEIKQTLIQNAEHMIFWVSLQIDIIWSECFNVAQVRAALANLPKDLDETYGRCWKRILDRQGIYSQGYAHKILPWLIEAVQPLSMPQLIQALAIDNESGCLIHDHKPLREDVIRSCANLITVDGDDKVILAHHSIRLYLESRMSRGNLLPRPLLEALLASVESVTSLSLARLCVNHLMSTDYELSLQRARPPILLQPPNVDLLVKTWFKRWPASMENVRAPRKAVPFVVPVPKGVFQHEALPEIFHYARQAWPALTSKWNQYRSDDKDSQTQIFHAKASNNLRDLVMQPNLTYKLHPWDPLGQSLDSHHFGLLGWAIANRHEAAFDMLMKLGSHELRIDLFSRPFPEYNGLNSFLLAARSKFPLLFDRVKSRVPVRMFSKLVASHDEQGWGLLHYAAAAGSEEMLTKLGVDMRAPNTADKNGITPLVLAASTGRVDLVDSILALPGTESAHSLFLATLEAIRHGYSLLLQGGLSLGSVYSPINEIVLQESFYSAARAGHLSVVKLILTWRVHHCTEPYFDSTILEILSGALDGIHLSIAKFVLQYDPITPYLREPLVQITSRAFGNLQWNPTIPMLEDRQTVVRAFLHKLVELDDAQESVAGLYTLSVAHRQPHLLDLLSEMGLGENYYHWIPSPSSLLQEAMSSEFEEIIELILKHRLISPFDDPFSILDLAISLDNTRVTAMLLESGVLTGEMQPNPIPRSMLSSKIVARVVSKGSDSMLFQILSYSSLWMYGKTSSSVPIFAAMRGEHLTKVKILYEAILAQSRREHQTHSSLESRMASLDSMNSLSCVCAEVLLAHDAESHLAKSGDFYPSALQKLEVCKGQLQTVIEERSIDVDIRNSQGSTLLHEAIRDRDEWMMKLMLLCGANINAKTQNGKTLLHLAVETFSTVHTSCIPLGKILEHTNTELINVQDSSGDTALHIAARHDRHSHTESLLCHGADRNIRNLAGHTPSLQNYYSWICVREREHEDHYV